METVGTCDCGHKIEDSGNAYCPSCGTVVRPVEFPIPVTFYLSDLCRDWHSGQTSAMYSVQCMSGIANEDTLVGLQGELRRMQTLIGLNPHLYLASDSELASKWLPILERWEATLPERD